MKQEVVDLLRNLQRLAEDRVQLVVLGQFKRGKTSLMNAIVGPPTRRPARSR